MQGISQTVSLVTGYGNIHHLHVYVLCTRALNVFVCTLVQGRPCTSRSQIPHNPSKAALTGNCCFVCPDS